MDTFNWAAAIAIGYLLLVLAFVFAYWNGAQIEFCEENGFDYYDYYDDSRACFKDNQDELVFKRIKCEDDLIAGFIFRPLIHSCNFVKEIRELN